MTPSCPIRHEQELWTPTPSVPCMQLTDPQGAGGCGKGPRAGAGLSRDRSAPLTVPVCPSFGTGPSAALHGGRWRPSTRGGSRALSHWGPGGGGTVPLAPDSPWASAEGPGCGAGPSAKGRRAAIWPHSAFPGHRGAEDRCLSPQRNIRSQSKVSMGSVQSRREVGRGEHRLLTGGLGAPRIPLPPEEPCLSCRRNGSERSYAQEKVREQGGGQRPEAPGPRILSVLSPPLPGTHLGPPGLLASSLWSGPDSKLGTRNGWGRLRTRSRAGRVASTPGYFRKHWPHVHTGHSQGMRTAGLELLQCPPQAPPWRVLQTHCLSPSCGYKLDTEQGPAGLAVCSCWEHHDPNPNPGGVVLGAGKGQGTRGETPAGPGGEALKPL